MMRHRIALQLLFVATLLAGGCAQNRMAAVNDSNEPTTVRIANNNWADMNIYLLRGSERRRLGTVNSHTVGVFQLPDHVFVGAGDVRLLADPIGSSRTHVSPPLVIGPGQDVEWRLENNLSLSSAFIR